MTIAATVKPITQHRMRLFLPAGKRNEAMLYEVCDALRDCPSIADVRPNPLTGSILIMHHSSQAGVMEDLSQRGLFDLQLSEQKKKAPKPIGKMFHQGIKQFIGDADKKLLDLSGGYLDFTSTVGIAFLSLAYYQIKKGLFLPTGLALMTLAFRTTKTGDEEAVADVNGEL